MTVTNLQAITQRLGTLMCKMTLILIQNELEITNAIRFAWFTGNNAKSVEFWPASELLEDKSKM